MTQNCTHAATISKNSRAIAVDWKNQNDMVESLTDERINRPDVEAIHSSDVLSDHIGLGTEERVLLSRIWGDDGTGLLMSDVEKLFCLHDFRNNEAMVDLRGPLRNSLIVLAGNMIEEENAGPQGQVSAVLRMPPYSFVTQF